MPKKKTNDEFLHDLSQKNPRIKPIEPYINAVTAIKCECCKCGYVWPAIPNNILRGGGCPNCAGNQRLTQEIFINRISKINPDITITGTYINSDTPIEYLCKKCGNTNKAVPYSLLQGHGCNKCGQEKRRRHRTKTTEVFRQEMAKTNPDIEFLEEYSGVSTPIRCQCKICGYRFTATPDDLLHGRKCDRCRLTHSPLKKTHDTFLEELEAINPNIEPLGQYDGISKKIQFRCKICNHKWFTRPEQLLRGQECPSCQRRWRTSFPEQAVLFYVKQKYPDAINTYREGFGRSELDIFIPTIQLGIEYDGRNWHKNKERIEKQKYETCHDRGIKLIRIRETTVEKTDPSDICDVIIYSNYGHTKRFSELDACITQLGELIHLSKDIDVNRDQLRIREQYYQKLLKESLETQYPYIAAEWYQPYNGSITPAMIRPRSNDRYYWKCTQCGYIYEAIVSNRTQGSGCPNCAHVKKITKTDFLISLKEKYPSIEYIDGYQRIDSTVIFVCKCCGMTQKKRARELLKSGCRNCNRKKRSKVAP